MGNKWGIVTYHQKHGSPYFLILMFPENIQFPNCCYNICHILQYCNHRYVYVFQTESRNEPESTAKIIIEYTTISHKKNWAYCYPATRMPSLLSTVSLKPIQTEVHNIPIHAWYKHANKDYVDRDPYPY